MVDVSDFICGIYLCIHPQHEHVKYFGLYGIYAQ